MRSEEIHIDSNHGFEFDKHAFEESVYRPIWGESWKEVTDGNDRDDFLDKEVTKTLYGEDEKDLERWRFNDPSLSDMGEQIRAFFTCVASAEWILDFFKATSDPASNEELEEKESMKSVRACIAKAKEISDVTHGFKPLFDRRIAELEQKIEEVKKSL